MSRYVSVVIFRQHLVLSVDEYGKITIVSQRFASPKELKDPNLSPSTLDHSDYLIPKERTKYDY